MRGERCFSLFGAVQRKNRRKLHAPKMMSTVKVTFAKQSIKWAQAMAAKRQKVVSQCAMQTSEEDAPDSVSLTSSSARTSCASSQQSSTAEGVSALDILLSGNIDFNNFVQREFQRAASALPVRRNIMMEVNALPIEDVQEAAPTSGTGGRQDEEVAREEDEEAGAEEEEEWIDWGPPRRNAFDDDSDPDYDPSNP